MNKYLDNLKAISDNYFIHGQDENSISVNTKGMICNIDHQGCKSGEFGLPLENEILFEGKAILPCNMPHA